jgi:putative phosphoribosyl transferase
MLRREAEDVVCLTSPHRFGSVGAFYQSFLQVTDAEVAALLREVAVRSASLGNS